MRNRIKQRMLRRIALAFAVAAVAAPTAQAVPLEPGATKAEQSDFNPGVIHMPRVTPTDYAIARGDGIELARLNGRGKGADVRSLDGVENVRIEPRGVGDSVLTSSRESFDWGDAGVGAGLSFAAILLAAAAALSVRQYGRLGQV
jgi:hypothetical protein